MKRLQVVLIVSGVALAQLSATCLRGQQVPIPKPPIKSDLAGSAMPSLPAVPRKESTVLGGEIKNVDPIRDEFVLKIPDEHPLKIFYDARTQIYRDGKKISLRDLAPVGRASVQTLLDGSQVFAVSIHILSQVPEGECEGRVVAYDPGSGALVIRSPLSPTPVKLIVASNTPVARAGQSSFKSSNAGVSDLVSGTLISARFKADSYGRSVADSISILAVPGSGFVFGGRIADLDVHAGMMTITNEQDGRNYQVSFNPALVAEPQNLRIGDQISVTANFDGARYVATAVSPH
ncbi:MAG TPA: hypothetical protein VKR52_15950 [Terracidiphilus sp.]|nr:hypothetical protein [Terracidiphilus sp.]